MRSIRTQLGGYVVEQNNATGRVSLWEESLHHSAADRDGVSTADYVHAMYSFLRQANARDVLMIGCGGGTLATMLYRGGARVTVVDIEPLAIAIARDYFHLPPQVPAHVADGLAYLRQHRHRHDAIVLDAFGQGGMPEAFQSAAFFRLVRSRLKARNSLFLMNVIVDDDNDPAPDDLVRRVATQWAKVRLLDTDGWIDRNAIIAAGAVAKLTRPQVMMPPRTGAARLERQVAVLDFRPIR